MKSIMMFAGYSIWTIILIIGVQIFMFKYDAGSQTIDAQKCLIKVAARTKGQLTFDWTGTVGTKFGNQRTLWLLGKEEALDGKTNWVTCFFQGEQLRIRHPVIGWIE